MKPVKVSVTLSLGEFPPVQDKISSGKKTKTKQKSTKQKTTATQTKKNTKNNNNNKTPQKGKIIAQGTQLQASSPNLQCLF